MLTTYLCGIHSLTLWIVIANLCFLSSYEAILHTKEKNNKELSTLSPFSEILSPDMFI